MCCVGMDLAEYIKQNASREQILDQYFRLSTAIDDVRLPIELDYLSIGHITVGKRCYPSSSHKRPMGS